MHLRYFGTVIHTTVLLQKHSFKCQVYRTELPLQLLVRRYSTEQFRNNVLH